MLPCLHCPIFLQSCNLICKGSHLAYKAAANISNRNERCSLSSTIHDLQP